MDYCKKNLLNRPPFTRVFPVYLLEKSGLPHDYFSNNPPEHFYDPFS